MIFFDLDGTLLDSNGVWLEIDIAFLGALGIDPIPPEYTHYVTHNSFNASARYTRDTYAPHMSTTQIVRAWQDMALDHYTHHLPLKPGARQLLETLKAQGERLGLLTSCMPSLALPALERHRLLHLFDALHFSHLIGVEKSAPSLYHTISRRHGLSDAHCVLVDDSPDYLAAAKQAGWQVWGVQDSLFDHRADEMSTLCSPGRYLDSLLSYSALHI